MLYHFSYFVLWRFSSYGAFVVALGHLRRFNLDVLID